MKIEDLKDCQVVYVLTTEGFFLGRRAYLNEKDAKAVKKQILKLCPGTKISVELTVASSVPQDFNIVKRIKND